MSQPLNLPADAPATRDPSRPILFTEAAVQRVIDALEMEDKRDHGLRVAVVGGGCAGFQYTLSFETQGRPGDTEWDEDGFHVFVDKLSVAYLSGVQIDFSSSPMGSGFKFANPNVTTTCGCGSSFA